MVVRPDLGEGVAYEEVGWAGDTPRPAARERATDRTTAHEFESASRDPLGAYLRRLGDVPLLTREGEIAIAMRAEAGELAVFDAIVG